MRKFLVLILILLLGGTTLTWMSEHRPDNIATGAKWLNENVNTPIKQVNEERKNHVHFKNFPLLALPTEDIEANYHGWGVGIAGAMTLLLFLFAWRGAGKNRTLQEQLEAAKQRAAEAEETQENHKSKKDMEVRETTMAHARLEKDYAKLEERLDQLGNPRALEAQRDEARAQVETLRDERDTAQKKCRKLRKKLVERDSELEHIEELLGVGKDNANDTIVSRILRLLQEPKSSGNLSETEKKLAEYDDRWETYRNLLNLSHGDSFAKAIAGMRVDLAQAQTELRQCRLVLNLNDAASLALKLGEMQHELGELRHKAQFFFTPEAHYKALTVLEEQKANAALKAVKAEAELAQLKLLGDPLKTLPQRLEEMEKLSDQLAKALGDLTTKERDLKTAQEALQRDRAQLTKDQELVTRHGIRLDQRVTELDARDVRLDKRQQDAEKQESSAKAATAELQKALVAASTPHSPPPLVPR